MHVLPFKILSMLVATVGECDFLAVLHVFFVALLSIPLQLSVLWKMLHLL